MLPSRQTFMEPVAARSRHSRRNDATTPQMARPTRTPAGPERRHQRRGRARRLREARSFFQKAPMKRLFLSLLLLCSTVRAVSPYPYMVVNYSYSTVGGVTSLNVHLHNNGELVAACDVTVFTHSRSVTVAPTGDETISFQGLPEGAQPRYGCIAE